MPQMPSVKHERVAPAAKAAAAMPARASEPGSGTITKQKDAGYQIWASCEVTQIWWLAPFYFRRRLRAQAAAAAMPMPARASAPGSGTITNCVTWLVVIVPPAKFAEATLTTYRMTLRVDE